MYGNWYSMLVVLRVKLAECKIMRATGAMGLGLGSPGRLAISLRF